MKRFIAFLLSVVLVISATVTAFAEDKKETAAKELEKYGILDARGYMGEIKTEGYVTRAEMAKMLVLMLGLTPGDAVADFSDVSGDHWAHSFISRAAAFGIINGMGDGTFLPDENITYQQAIKMVVCTLGYKVAAERKGGYPHGYIMTAMDLGLTPSKAEIQAKADRGEIFLMLKKALDVPVMVVTEYEGNTAYKILDGKNGERFVSIRTRLE